MTRGERKVVCVTGASGFIASSLVKDLLLNGYTVHATVRNLHDPTKVDHLNSLQGAQQRLRLFQADLLEQGSFDAAVDGCDGVFHTASPVIFKDINDPQMDLIQPAVNGTLNVLRSCLKAPSIKRVVLTSSIAAVLASSRSGVMCEVEVDETWYSDPAFCEELKAWYYLSKTLAEGEAQKFANQNGIDMVVLNPGLVIGRCLQPNINYTFQDFLMILREGKGLILPFGVLPLVDVRDVVQAHISAFEKPSANGRYCLVAATLHTCQMFDMLRHLYPTLSLPQIDGGDGATMEKPLKEISKEKAKSLGINYIPIEDSLKETIELLKERNLLVIT